MLVDVSGRWSKDQVFEKSFPKNEILADTGTEFMLSVWALTLKNTSDVESYFDHIAVFDHVVFAIEFIEFGFLGGFFRAGGDQGFVGDGFGADEAAFQVRMDFSCCFWCGSAIGDWPGADFVRATGEEVNQTEALAC